MPAALFADRCHAAEPTLHEVDELAARFGTSLHAAAVRYAGFASSACALVECAAGDDGPRVRRVTRSASFRGDAAARRRLEAGSLAAALARGRDEPATAGPRPVSAWGAAALGVELREHAVRVGDSAIVLAWLWHPPCPGGQAR